MEPEGSFSYKSKEQIKVVTKHAVKCLRYSRFRDTHTLSRWCRGPYTANRHGAARGRGGGKV